MSILVADEVICVGKNVNSSRPVTLQPGRHYSSDNDKMKDAATQVSKKKIVPWAVKQFKGKQTGPSHVDGKIHPTSAGTDNSNDKHVCFRRKSANIVLQYADLPIEITNHHLGRPTRGTILRNLKRSQSASSICSDFSWIKGNRRLCNIRDYYRLYKAEKVDASNSEPIHGYLTGARFTHAKWLDSVSVKAKSLYINKQDLGNVFLNSKSPPIRNQMTQQYSNERGKTVLEITGKEIMKDASVNTKDHYLSLHRWHGANWQRHLPEMYKPVQEKYDSYGSIVVRAKKVKSVYRDAMAIPIAKKS